jgi:ribosome biogenesis protein BMS1
MDQLNRPHRKTKEKKKHSGGPNAKAFAFAKPGRLQKAATRSHDVKEKRLHVPLVDRIPEEPPPLVVGVVGPPGVCRFFLKNRVLLMVYRLEKLPS